MILSNAPQNQAVMSNVGEIGEFRIRNSAKAFSILSSGLYANKIRAIIRELSCNAVDSHVAAGKADVPFEVHVPNPLEPHFSIRDFGTGLSHEQVTQIYTTYFESTKTNSNDFIGALGLGSKSPFSYTDNFTVTAVKDGKRGVYSAFINGEGVPSIALMMSEETTDPSGVEIKFSVNDRYDFSKFRDEARVVFKYFKLRPLIRGDASFKFDNVEYETKDIIKGVHSLVTRNGRGECVAVMGNIAYPIEVPNSSQLGDVGALLTCALEINFDIGELDFQASREGLSYIPETIQAIKNKLEAVNAQLAIHIATEADKIENTWDRALFLAKKKDNVLWNAAINKYVADTNLETYDTGSWLKLKTFKLDVATLATDMNISLRGFQRVRSSSTASTLKPSNEWVRANNQHVAVPQWHLSVSDSCMFVTNDTNIGATERAKHHYKEKQQDMKEYAVSVYVLEPVDRDKDMNTELFFKTIMNPPAARKVNASDLMVKPRKESSVGKNVTLLTLQERGSGGYYRQKELVWRDAGTINSLDATKTHYYIPLSGFVAISDHGITDVKLLTNAMDGCGVAALKDVTVYGVRKNDLPDVKSRKNWVNVEKLLVDTLSKLDNKVVMSTVMRSLDGFDYLNSYNPDIVSAVGVDSPYAKFVSNFNGFEKSKQDDSYLKMLLKAYAKNVNFDPNAIVQKYLSEAQALNCRYPLLQCLNHRAKSYDIALYIKSIDTLKGI